MTIKIDYAPTDWLLDHPLDPCDNPWLKTQIVKYSSLWEQKDLEDFICQVLELNIHACLVTSNSTYPTLDKAALLHLLRITPAWDLYLPVGEIYYPREEVAIWKNKPVVHVWGPQVIFDTTGLSTTMYFIEYATKVISGAKTIRQPDEFLTFTQSLTNWLTKYNTSERGKGTYDNPTLFQKFREW